MRRIVNVHQLKPDEDPRSLRARVKDRDETVLRDTYFLVDPDTSPSQRLKMGLTVIYPTGSTTGHTHDGIEEVYYVISGEGIMVVGESEFPIKPGDALYVPPGAFHTTYQRGNLPLTVLWVTGDLREDRD